MNESRKQLYLNLINELLTCDEGEEPDILRENADLIDAELVLMMERVVSVLEERDARQQAEWLQELANRLGESLEMPSVDGREEREVYQQVRSLERRFGKGHLYFAYHAAFPLALTPDLCYQIWVNFQRDVDKNRLDIPWIAVADLLLSGLCHPVGHELYEMDLAVRNLLLKELRNHFNFGEKRMKELSTFMLEYVREQINSEDEDIRDFATVQRWTALAYVEPGKAARELALTLREKVREGNKAELVRLSSVLENLAEPLRGEYEPLLVYGRGMGRLARGDSEGASREFQGLGEVGNWLSVSRVGLPIPGEVDDGGVFGDLRLRLEWQEIREKRRQEYLNLIQLLLDCSAGEEGEILREHQSLVDLVLVETMREVAANLLKKGEQNAAGFLENLANRLSDALNSSVEATHIEAKHQEYLDFLAEVLQATSDSDASPQVVYPLLAANQDKLDDNFIHTLQTWAEAIRPEVEASQAEGIARVIGEFSNLIQQFPLGNKGANMDIAIAGYEIMLTVFTRPSHPETWAIIQNNLGAAYLYRIRHDRAENLEKAIEAYQLALKVRTPNDFPIQWAATQNNLGNAYRDRICGDRAENLEKAIEAYQLALEVRTPNDFPIDWAQTQNNLGAAYSDRIRHDRAENLEKAIEAYQLALEVRTPKDFPIDWAMTQNNLGNAYRNRIRHDRAENLEKAIEAFQLALEVRTKNDLPIEWAATQNNLGNAYSNRIRHDRAENLEKAIEAFQLALEVYTKNDFPYEWATTQNNLGAAYSDRIRHDRAENLEKAIEAYQLALEVRTKNDLPIDWAMTQNNLGGAYSDRIRHDRAENLEKAIEAYQLALEVYTKKDFPIDWATTQNNLGAAYRNRIRHDRAENLEKAIEAYQLALEVRTPNDFPIQWATTQNNLGAAYSDRIRHDRAENLEKAIEAYQLALEVYTPEADPITCLTTSRNLGNLHFTQGDWQRAIQTYETTLQAVELLRESAITEGRRQEIIEEAIEVYQNLTQAYINTRNYPKAIQTAERSKARNLLELMVNRDLYPKGNVPPEILAELDRLRRLLENQTRELQSLNAENTGTPRPQPDANPDNTDQTLSAPQQQPAQIQQTRERLGQEIADTRQKLDALIEKDITPIDPNFSLTQEVKTITYQQIQELTADGQTALIEWYVTEEKILTFILLPPLPQTDSSLLVREFGGEDPQKLIDFANKYVNSYYADKQHQQWRGELENNLQELANILHLDELVADIQQNFAASNQTCQQLILIPHRFLHICPIHALPVKQRESTGTATTHLLDLFPGGVGYAPSCQLLHRVRAKQPTFDNFFAVQTPTPDLYKDYEADLGAVGAVKKQFRQSEILSKAAATKTALLDSPLAEANCLFFFCHGTFNLQSPVDSGLLLADGILTVGDIIAEIDLRNCRLVTLFTSESGLSQFTSTSDEYIGLSSAFMLAGSSNVIGSLWTVNAFATALLTTRFYQEVESCGNIVLALKLAQTWLRDSTIEDFQAWLPHSPLDEEWQEVLEENLEEWEEGATSKPYASPYYWGAFCAIGSGI